MTSRLRRVAVVSLGGLILAACGSPAPGLAGPGTGTVGASDIISTVTGDPPNFAQMANGSLMTVVSRDYGRGAEAGALVEFYYPHQSTDQLWDSYVGVRIAGDLRWAHELTLLGQRILPDTGQVESVFSGVGGGTTFELVIDDLVLPRSDVHVRHVRLIDTGRAPLTGAALDDYSYFMLDSWPWGDKLSFSPATRTFTQTDSGVAVAVSTDRPVTAWQCGLANLPLGDHEDARMAAEAGHLSDTTQSGPSPGGVNQVMESALPSLAPGQSADTTYAIGAGATADQAQAAAASALAGGWPAASAQDQSFWGQRLAAARMPQNLSGLELACYRRALITLWQHVADTGAILAAPTNLDPPYRFTWPRDGVFISLALLDAGDPLPAEHLFPFLERLQKPDGSWAVNYFPDGSKPLWDFGTRGNEHDQDGIFAWGAWQVYQKLGDRAWLAARWPAVEKACDFLVGQQQPDGLLSTCRDLWELSTDGTWTFSNAAAWAGLEAGAQMARTQGDGADAARFQAAADRLRTAIDTELVTGGGYFGRGLSGGRVDPTLEAANLALGSAWFGVVPDDDPKMVRTASLLARNLTSPWGGLRRNQGDTYYGGQPWPVTTGWLGLYRLSQGDRAGARQALDVMTRYAAQTNSLMLGEQFDEATGRWASAFPLAWSEATYVRLALALGSSSQP